MEMTNLPAPWGSGNPLVHLALQHLGFCYEDGHWKATHTFVCLHIYACRTYTPQKRENNVI